MSKEPSEKGIFKTALLLVENISNVGQARLLLIVIFLCVVALFEMLSIGLVLPLVYAIFNPDSVLQELPSWVSAVALAAEELSGISLVEFFSLVFALVFILAATLRYFLMQYVQMNTADIGVEISGAVYRSVLNLDYLEFKRKDSSGFVSNLTTKNSLLIHGFLNPLINSIVSIVLLLSLMLPVLFYVGAEVFVLISFISSIYLGVYFFARKRKEEISIDLRDCPSMSVKTLQESFRGFINVMLDGLVEEKVNLYKGYEGRFRHAQVKVTMLSLRARAIIECVAVSSMLIYFVYAQASNVEQAVASISLLVVTFQRALPYFHQIYTAQVNVRSNQKVVLEFLDYLEGKQVIKCAHDKEEMLCKLNEIQLQGVSFEYGGKRILEDLDLTLKPGDWLAIRGKSGIGKTTFVEVVVGLLSPSRGRVCFEAPSGRTTANFYKMFNIGYVSQSFGLLNESVETNIGLARKDRDQGAYLTAVHCACLTEDMLLLETVGENGCALSGGQRQRLAIARALYKQPSILILDESTSGLDTITETEILGRIKQEFPRLIVMLISHREGAFDLCNREIDYLDGVLKVVPEC